MAPYVGTRKPPTPSGWSSISVGCGIEIRPIDVSAVLWYYQAQRLLMARCARLISASMIILGDIRDVFLVLA